MEIVDNIKVEVDDDDDCDNNNMTRLPVEQPLALVKRKERDITERFPYIEEVTTTTPTRYLLLIHSHTKCQVPKNACFFFYLTQF